MIAVAAALLAATTGLHPWDERFGAPAADVARAAAALSPAPGAPAELLLRDSRHVVDAEGRLTRTIRIVYRVHSREAVETLGTPTATWADWWQEPTAIRGRVVTPDGAEHALDPATIVEGPADETPGRLSDQRMRRAPLPALAVGAIAEVEFTTRDREPNPAGGDAWIENLGTAAQRLRFRVEAPAAFPLRIASQGAGAPRPRESRSGGRRVLEWDLTGLSEGEEEPGVPASIAPGRWIGYSTGASWAAIARRWSALVDERLAGADLAPLAREIAAGAPGRDAAAARVLAWMGARLRYTGLSLGAAAIVPARPADVLARRYGDCKDLSLLLVGLMRALGHEAHLVLVRTGPGALDDLVAGAVFDHAIVRLGGERPIFVDPTFPQLGPGRLPTGVDGRPALVARDGSSALERLPPAPLADYTARIEREILLADEGPAFAREVRTLEGVMAAEMRHVHAAAAGDEVRTREAAEVAQRLRADAASAEYEERADGSVELVGEARGSKLGALREDDAEARLEPRALVCLPDALREPPGAVPRRAPLEIDRPCAVELRYRVRPRAGFRPAGALPAPFSMSIAGFRYAFEASPEQDGGVSARFELALPRGPISPADVERIRAELSRLDAEGPLVRLERTSARLLSAGRGKEALEELRRVAAETGDVADRSRLANALVRLGLGAAAREEARAATRATPRSFRALETLSNVLAHDELGRWLAPGCDRDGAVAARREALELDGTKQWNRGYLGWLLLHGRRCDLLGEGADAEAALPLLRAGAEAKADDWRGRLALALLATGRFEEAIVEARALERGGDADGVLLAALARARGVEAAAEEARHLGAEQRGSALFRAGRLLAARRGYAEAAALLRAASPGADGLPRLLAFAGVLEAAARLHRTPPPPGSPLAVPRALFAGGLGAGDPAALFVGEPEAARASAAALGRVAAWAWGHEVPREIAAELAAAEWNPRFRELAPDLGRLDGDGGRRLYLVRERGAWRVADGAGGGAELAAEALRLSAGGRREAGLAVAALALEEAGGEGDDAGTLAKLARAFSDARGEPLAGAAVLAAASRRPELAIAALAALDAAPAGGHAAGAAGATAALGSARGLALLRAGRHAEALAAADAALARDPGSPLALEVKVRALRALGRADAARQALRDGAGAAPGEPGLRVAAELTLHGGDVEAAIPLYRRLLGSRGGRPADANNLAWAQLFVEPLAPSAVTDAQRGSAPGEHGALHTLAAVLAAAGEAREASRVLRDAVDRNGGAAIPEDHLVTGLIAEVYGLPAAAAQAYARVVAEAPRADDAVSPRALAQRRLSALERREGPAPPGGGAGAPR